MGPQHDLERVEREALARRATERLVRIDDIRAAHRLAAAGVPQRRIAESLRTTQPRVHRMLRAPSSDEPTPEEVILRALVEHADRETLVRELSRRRYTFREHAPEPFEGATRGTWDQVRAAFADGLLSEDEFARVRAAVGPPAP